MQIEDTTPMRVDIVSERERARDEGACIVPHTHNASVCRKGMRRTCAGTCASAYAHFVAACNVHFRWIRYLLDYDQIMFHRNRTFYPWYLCKTTDDQRSTSIQTTQVQLDCFEFPIAAARAKYSKCQQLKFGRIWAERPDLNIHAIRYMQMRRLHRMIK